MALVEIKMDKFHYSGFLPLVWKANKACNSDNEADIYPRFKDTGGKGGLLSTQSSVHDLWSYSIRQQ